MEENEVTTQPAEESTPAAPSDTTSGTEPEKTFTQSEVNRLMKAEKEKSKTAILKELGVSDFKTAKEGLAKYFETLEASKSDLQKATETASNYKQSLDSVSKENDMLKAQIEALSLGANPETVSELAAIAATKTDENNDIKSVINSLKENAAYSGFFRKTESGGTGNPIGNKPAAGITEGYGERLAKSRIARGQKI